MVESHVERVTIGGGFLDPTANLAATTAMGALSKFLLELLLKKRWIQLNTNIHILQSSAFSSF